MSDTENHRKPLISEPLRTVVLSGVLALSSLAVLATAAAREPETFTERVQFAPGTSKDILAGALAPGESRRSVVNARDKNVHREPAAEQRRNPFQRIRARRGAALHEGVKGGNQYKGQLHRSGDHVVEVYYRGNESSSKYEVEIVIK